MQMPGWWYVVAGALLHICCTVDVVTRMLWVITRVLLFSCSDVVAGC